MQLRLATSRPYEFQGRICCLELNKQDEGRFSLEGGFVSLDKFWFKIIIMKLK